MLKSFEDTVSTVQLQAGQLLSVYAVSAGRVVKAENNLIEIEHEDGLISSYGGCASKYIKAGDEVKAGEMIGLLSVETPVLDFGLKRMGSMWIRHSILTLRLVSREGNFVIKAFKSYLPIMFAVISVNDGRI